MNPKQLKFGSEARESMLKGIEKLGRAVTTTLGPKGRNVALNMGYKIDVVHDGVTVAKQIKLENPFENMGAELVIESASKTNDTAGDGTTTATLLAWKMCDQGMQLVEQGTNPMIMKRGIDKAVAHVIEEIKKVSKPVTENDWEKIATISAQNEEVGKKIAEAIRLVGKDGIVEVNEGNGMTIEIEHKDGMEFDKGYESPYFITNPDSMEVSLDKPLFLITDQTMSNAELLLPLWEEVANQGKPIVIIANDFDPLAIKFFVVNKMQGQIKPLLVKAPGFGDLKKEMLLDIATLTGSTLITEDTGRKITEIEFEDLGSSDNIRATKDATRIVGGKGDIKVRIKQINASIKKAKTEFDKQKLRERKSKLTNGVAVIQVGATTEVERKNLVERVKDAKEATKSAIKSGIIVGGGTVFMDIANNMDLISGNSEELAGIDLIKSVLFEPIRLLAENSGRDADEVIAGCKDGKGFNALTGEFEDLEKAGVIEPALVAIEALRNASSVASMVLTTECMVTPIEKK